MDINLEQIIEQAATKYSVDPKLIKAVMKQESNFNPKAVSHAGAQGLMQLMPATAKDLGVTDSFNPVQNVEGGVKYLSQQLQKFGSVPLALAAYNAGPGAVQKHGNQIPPYRETQDYVQRITSSYYGQNPQARSQVFQPNQQGTTMGNEFNSLLQNARNAFQQEQVQSQSIAAEMETLFRDSYAKSQELGKIKGKIAVELAEQSNAIADKPAAHLADMTQYLIEQQQNLVTTQRNAHQFAVDSNILSNPANWLYMQTNGNPYEQRAAVLGQNIEQIEQATNALANNVTKQFDIGAKRISQSQLEAADLENNLLLQDLEAKFLQSKWDMTKDSKESAFHLELAKATSLDANREETLLLRTEQMEQNRLIKTAAMEQQKEIEIGKLEEKREARKSKTQESTAKLEIMQANTELKYLSRADALLKTEKEMEYKWAQENRRIEEGLRTAATTEERTALEAKKLELARQKQVFTESNQSKLTEIRGFLAENDVNSTRLRDNLAKEKAEIDALKQELAEKKFASEEEREAFAQDIKMKEMDWRNRSLDIKKSNQDAKLGLDFIKEARKMAVERMRTAYESGELSKQGMDAVMASTLDEALGELGSPLSGVALMGDKTQEGKKRVNGLLTYISTGRLGASIHQSVDIAAGLIDMGTLKPAQRQMVGQLRNAMEAAGVDYKKDHPYVFDQKIVKVLEKQSMLAHENTGDKFYGMAAPVNYKLDLGHKGKGELIDWMEKSGLQDTEISPLAVVSHLNAWFKDKPEPEKFILISDYFKAVTAGNNRQKGYATYNIPEQKQFLVKAQGTGSSLLSSGYSYDLSNPEDVKKYIVGNKARELADTVLNPSVAVTRLLDRLPTP